MADRGIGLLIKSLAKYSVSLQTTGDVCKMSAYGCCYSGFRVSLGFRV